MRGSLCALVVLIGLVLSSGCGPSAEKGKGEVVASLSDRKLTLDDLRVEYDVRNGRGAFDRLPVEQKQEFLETIGDKEVLLRLARQAVGQLEAPYDRFAREAVDEHVLKAFERRLRVPIDRDTATTRALLGKLNKQLDISWLVTHSDSTAQLAREMVVAGGSFADATRRYCVEDSVRKIGGRLGWLAADAMGPLFTEELFFTDREAGYLSQVQATPRGFEMILVHDSRPFDMRNRPSKIFEGMPGYINGILFQRRSRDWVDSVKTARSYKLHEETIPLFRLRMKTFWDSLEANGSQADQVAQSFEPPLRVFRQEELGQTLYDLDGKPHRIREFLEALRTAPMTAWPFGKDDKAMRQQIDRRMSLVFQLEAARALGLDRDPFVLAQNRISEEKFWIERFHKKVIEPTIGVVTEEAQSYYEQNKANYKRGDKIRFSYVAFPTREEADRFYRQAIVSDGRWWATQIGDFSKERPELPVVANSQDYDLTLPIPEEVRGMVEQGMDKAVTEVLRPVPFPGQRWAVGRVLYREKPGFLTFEKVEAGIKRRLTDQKTTQKIDTMVKEGREKYKLRLFPEKLGTGGVSAPAASQRAMEKGSGQPPTRRRNPSSSRTATPSSRARSSFEPGSAPATR